MHRLADLEQVVRRNISRIAYWQREGRGEARGNGCHPERADGPDARGRASLVRVSRIAPVGLSHKNSKAATVPNAPVRAVASPMIKRIVSCVARKQDKQKIL